MQINLPLAVKKQTFLIVNRKSHHPIETLTKAFKKAFSIGGIWNLVCSHGN